ncbi:MAG: VOC family protein [Saprospiraceae bacterium]|nr:VOC family protein [Saprospiraceae bacterium]MCB0624785.1 VOC family protein [Saprospiraceae bacterium]MCB0675731.1 VOC family protein [Saprospiraceae bacterium]MCB0683822.1 VOC family protein [Saprospiraceae bacterium]
MFRISHFDHIGLRVRHLERSARWYEQVLGLTRVQPEEWQPFPIFLVAGGTGLALFPPHTDDPESLPSGDWLIVDHFAFRVDAENFELAQRHLNELGIEFQIQDHHYFHSLYFRDPDGHKVELTTAVKALEGL